MNQIVDIHYLIDSEECLLIDYIAQLGIDKEIEVNGNKYNTNSDDFLRKVIIKKLFRKFSDTNTEEHFKNKYLYYLSGGAIGYLDAIYSMDYSSLIKSEADNLKILLAGIKVTNYDFVSIGAAEGMKDIKIINTLFNNNQNFTYYPIDISPTLLQLNINRFNNNFKNKNDWKIEPITADFFDLKKDGVTNSITAIFNNNKLKIFMLLGGTIGNYKEDDLIDNIKAIMTEDDFLVVSFELYENDRQLEDIVKRYFTSGNLEFLSNPLKLIPHFKGFLDNRSKYFNLYGDKFVEDADQSISIFSESKIYKPSIKIPTFDANYVVAWTTRYKANKLKSEIESKFNMKIVMKNTNDKNLLFLLKKEEVSTPGAS